MTLTSKFDLGQEVWFMADDRAIKGTVSRVALADTKGQDNVDCESVNEYCESYHASYPCPFVRHGEEKPRWCTKYFNHEDIGRTIFITREDLIKTI